MSGSHPSSPTHGWCSEGAALNRTGFTKLGPRDEEEVSLPMEPLEGAGVASRLGKPSASPRRGNPDPPRPAGAAGAPPARLPLIESKRAARGWPGVETPAGGRPPPAAWRPSCPRGGGGEGTASPRKPEREGARGLLGSLARARGLLASLARAREKPQPRATLARTPKPAQPEPTQPLARLSLDPARCSARREG